MIIFSSFHLSLQNLVQKVVPSIFKIIGNKNVINNLKRTFAKINKTKITRRIAGNQLAIRSYNFNYTFYTFSNFKMENRYKYQKES